MGKESNTEGAIRRVGLALAHDGIRLGKGGIRVRSKLGPHWLDNRFDQGLEIELLCQSDTDTTRHYSPCHLQILALQESTSMSAHRSNKYGYDVLHAHSQTEMSQGPHKVGGIDTKTPLESTIKGHTSACHFAQRESETMLAGIKAETYM